MTRFGRSVKCVLATLVLLAMPALAETGKTIEVALGKTVARTWEQVKADKYAYGPKQDYDAAKKQTHIYLPYGPKGTYFEVVGLKLTMPDETGSPLAMSSPDGNTSGKLVYKCHFDKPISSFRFYAGWSEWGSGGDAVGGVEYSVDGAKWVTIRENNQSKIIEPFCDGKKVFDGLKTQDLYIRCYSRDKNSPESAYGPGRWMKFRMAGDPGWGDIATTFFSTQLQLWVTSAE